MSNTDSDAKYVEYKHYEEVKHQFDRSESFDYDKKEYEEIISDINIKQNELESLDKTFLRLNKTLKNSSVFFKHYLIENYCIYINFWLNEELRRIYNVVYDTNFNIFKKFLVSFNNKRFRYVKNTCHGYLKYLNDDVYKRMLILDNLYDKYKQLKSFEGPENDKLCSIFSVIGQNYKSAFANNQADSNFLKALKDYTQLIKKNNWASNTTCPAENYITLPEQKPPQQIEDSKASKQPITSHQASVSQESPRAQNTLRLEDVSEKQATQDLLKPPETVGVSETSILLGSYDEQVTRHTSGPQISLGPRIPGLPANRDNYELLSLQQRAPITSKDQTHISSGYGKADTDVMMGAVQDRITEVDPNTQTIPKDGLLNKMQYFFSETIGQVEPAPILGVSGGMGALFLLFRYTPVGTFFGGRRGRNHRIPSGFPGAYPGFSEYYDGNLGNMPINLSYQP